VITKGKPNHAFAIAVHGDYVYWTDWVLLSVLRASKYAVEDVQILRKDIPKPMGIVAVSQQTDICSANPCNILNGGCTDLCKINEYSHPVCYCGLGKILMDDGRCVQAKPAMSSEANCTEDSFQCETGGCISYELSCDNHVHCPDGSDESATYCGSRVCKTGFFRCPSNRCIHQTKVCDGGLF